MEQLRNEKLSHCEPYVHAVLKAEMCIEKP